MLAPVCLVVAGILTVPVMPASLGSAAPALPASPDRFVSFETQDHLTTATFSDRTDDTALSAAVPILVARGVQAVNLRGAPVHDITPLASLPGLKMLDLRGTQVQDVTPLARLTGLQSLTLQFLRVEDVKPLGGLVNLRSLNLCGTDVRDLAPLETLVNLQTLVLSVTKVKDLTPLATLRQLTSLDVGSTRVEDIEPLRGMVNLRFLSLNGTAVADIQPLAGMSKLEMLDLGGTQVSDLRPIGRLYNLRVLDLESTEVADVRPLAMLRGLSSLSLGGSRVTDLSPLADLAVAPALGVQPAPVSADPVMFWNDQTNLAIQATKADPFQASRALALESIVVLDTLRSLHGEPAFMVRLPQPGDVPVDIAIAAAAQTLLSHLFPIRQAALDAALALELAAQPDAFARRRATEFGHAIALGVIAIRDGDGWRSADSIPAGVEPGQWRPTPPSFLPAMDPQWATMPPFAMTRPNQFRPAGPPAPGSAAFNAARRMVATKGARDSSERTAEQTEVARYWNDAIGTYAPAGHWNAIAAEIGRSMQLGLSAKAELFAELNVAMADATIAMADAKYAYRFWRPITAIRSGDEGDAPIPDWSPLLVTPNHPSYISGHSAVSGAAAVILTQWFGVRPFAFISASLPGVTRSFISFQQAAEEAAQSRVYGGIHFPFDNADGLATGRSVGEWTLRVFHGPDLDRGPFIMVDRMLEPSDQPVEPITGCALDNLSPVTSLMASLDGGRAFTVAVDGGGRFMLPVDAVRHHDLVLTATSMTGRTTTTHIRLQDGASADIEAGRNGQN